MCVDRLAAEDESGEEEDMGQPEMVPPHITSWREKVRD